MNRRSFLKSILAAGVAPAFVGSSVLMPVRQLWTPEPYSWVASMERGMWVVTNNGLYEMTVRGFEARSDSFSIDYEVHVPGDGVLIRPGESRVFVGPSNSRMVETGYIQKLRFTT